MNPSGPKKCPLCGKLADEKSRPFCSSRCAMLDLGGWFNEKYRMPSDINPDEIEVLPDGGDNQ